MDMTLLDHPGNSVYRCFYTFCNSLNHLSSSSKPKIKIVMLQGMQIENVTEEEENSQGDQQDMPEYIGAFTHLESLDLGPSAFGSIYNLEKYLSHYSNGLKVLDIDGFEEPPEEPFEPLEEVGKDSLEVAFLLMQARRLASRIGGGVPSASLSTSQRLMAENPQKTTSIKHLVVSHYTPKNLYYEIMFIKKKFVNLDILYFGNQFGVFWSPLSDLELEAIMAYLFTLKRFVVSPAFRITLDSVKQTFDCFLQHQSNTNSSRSKKENLLKQGAFQGMYIVNGHSTNAVMRVPMDKEPFYRDDATNYEAAMDQFMNIIKHVGPHIHVLKVDTRDRRESAKYNFYTFELSDGTALKPLSCNLVENVLVTCTSLQMLSIWRARFLE